MSKSNQANGSSRPAIDEAAIAKRAYELFLQRGSVPGYELDDWLAAEAELTAAASAARTAGDLNDIGERRDTRNGESNGRSATRERTSPRRAARQ